MEYNVEKEKREAIEAGQRALNNLCLLYTSRCV